MTLERLRASLADRYRIERELGQGGMATVYLAHDLRHERDVAVKVLREDLAASLGGGRFLREIKIAAQLQHPHILPLLDSGEADGFLFFVMPYVKGQSLRERLAREGELPVHEAVRLLIEVVDALVEAHAHGVVHRDIKPDNVMLSGRHALVTDFGVAKAVSEATGRNAVTTAGVALGTPTYMSPEQAAADPHVDHRSDIYSVGVMGYEMLCGRPPFTGATPQQVLAAHVTEAPEPVARRRPAISPVLEQVVMTCLAKHAADRYQTAADLLAALEPLATPSTGITPTATRPLVAVSRRRGWGLAMAGAVALGLAGVLLWRQRGGAPRTPVTLDRVQLTTSGQASNAVVSPDGKQVVYTEQPCPADARRCTQRLVVQDVATGARQVLVDSADLVAPYQWSPSGGWIMTSIRAVGAAAGPQSSIISRLGGSPVRLGGPAAFTPGGDTAFVAPDNTVGAPHSVLLKAYVAPWTQAVDSAPLPVPDGVLQLDEMTVSPSGRWIALRWDLIRQWDAVLCIVDRHGRLASSRPIPGPNRGNAPVGDWNAAGTALVRPINVNGQGAVERISVDPGSGALGATDTITLSANDWLPGFSRSADGTITAYTEAHSGEKAIWTLTAPTPTQVPEKARLVTSGAALVYALITPDGQTVVYAAAAAAGAEIRLQFLATPFTGGSPRAVTSLLGHVMGALASWDSRRLVVATRGTAEASQITSYDIATGRVTASVQRSDTAFTLASAGTGQVALVAKQLVTILDDSLHERRRVVIPDSVGQAILGMGNPRGAGMALLLVPRDLAGFSSGGGDYSGFLYTITASGRVERSSAWHAAFSSLGGWWWDNDGSLRFIASTTAEPSRAINRVPPGGGPQQRLGPIPIHNDNNMDFSADGRRAVVTVAPTISDIWLLRNFAPAQR
jgi:tRNA A-37 threonylcarbamoyl transferase component Bud32